jgi:hypothetical protein
MKKLYHYLGFSSFILFLAGFLMACELVETNEDNIEKKEFEVNYEVVIIYKNRTITDIVSKTILPGLEKIITLSSGAETKRTYSGKFNYKERFDNDLYMYINLLNIATIENKGKYEVVIDVKVGDQEYHAEYVFLKDLYKEWRFSPD